MGTVFLAERADGAFERSVALKLVRASQQLGQHEVAAIARLEHPGIARLYDAGQVDLGSDDTSGGGQHWYFVMELIEGRPFGPALAKAPLHDRLAAARQLCAAVAFGHAAGVVHGDLKDSNVLVDEDHQPHIIDFGVAQLLDEPAPALSLSTNADTRALRQLLAQVFPETGHDPGLTAIFSADHFKGQIQTHATAAALSADLTRWASGHSPLVLQGAYGYRLRRWALRSRWWLLAAVLALVVGGFAFRQNQHAAAAQAVSTERTAALSAAARSLIGGVHDALNGLQGNAAARERVVAEAIGMLDGVPAGSLDPATTLLLAEGYYKLGYVQGVQGSASLGRLGDAKASFASGLGVLDRMPAAAAGLPDSLQLTHARVRGRLTEKLGAATAHAGQVAAGLAIVDSATAIFREATLRWPASGTMATLLGGALINRGDFRGHPYFPNVGDAAGAIADYDEAERVLMAIPASQRELYTERLQALTYERQSAMHRQVEDWNAAEATIRKAIAFRRRPSKVASPTGPPTAICSSRASNSERSSCKPVVMRRPYPTSRCPTPTSASASRPMSRTRVPKRT